MSVKLLASTAAVAAALSWGAASAATPATATVDLNVRSGPGPQFPVVGVINANENVTINGCIAGSKWCTVSHAGSDGWAYSDYLVADLSGSPVVVTEGRADIGVPVVTYEGEGSILGGGAAGVATGAVAGAIVGGPVGAAIGAAAGAAAGATAGAVIDPPTEVRTYVSSNPVEPVYLEGEVVVGASVPDTVVLQPIPDYQYQYAYVNSQPVLIDPGSRQIVYVVR